MTGKTASDLQDERQRYFDTVVRHLVAQGRRAYGGGIVRQGDGVSCRYRAAVGDEILKCAIGCLIPDDQYAPAMEGQTVTAIVSTHDFFKRFPWVRAAYVHKGLLRRLQSAHDRRAAGETLRDLLLDIALDYGLNTDAVPDLSAFPEEWK